MKKELIMGLLLIILAFLVGCVETEEVQKEYVCSNKIVVSDPGDCPTLDVKIGSALKIECVSDVECPGQGGTWKTQENGYTQVKYGCNLNINMCVVEDARLAECTEVHPC
jgi:hypothetical protein